MALAGKAAAEAVDEAREAVLPDWLWYSFNHELHLHVRCIEVE
jgi:hypothetical protein